MNVLEVVRRPDLQTSDLGVGGPAIGELAAGRVNAEYRTLAVLATIHLRSVAASGTGYPAAVPDDAALTDLLGALAYGELTAFDRLAEDARMSPTLPGRAALAQMAAVEIGHYRLLAERLEMLGAVPEEAMAPFAPALDGFHAMTVPADWLEGLVKAYVGDGLAADFYREIADYVDPATRELIIEVLADTGSAAFAVREVRAAIAANPAIAGRLALWGRRLVGEAISQTQHVLAEHDSLTELLVEGAGDLTGVAALIKRITDKHSERMAALGLSG